jgi:hypothetical protein
MAAVAGASIAVALIPSSLGFPHRPDLTEEMVCTRLIDFNDRGGQPPMVITFDNLPPGIDLSDVSMCGVVFAAKNAPLMVVRGDETYTAAGVQRFVPRAKRLPAQSHYRRATAFAGRTRAGAGTAAGLRR